MWIVLALLLTGHIDHDPSLKDNVEMIELNHLYDGQGKLVLDQWIFYDWSGRLSQFVVVDWRRSKTDIFVSKNWKTGEYNLTFFDGDYLRKIRSKIYRETWTQYDPELKNREIVPVEHRRLLTPPRK